MNLQKDIDILIEANVISEEAGINIKNYYLQKNGGQPNRLMLIFGILGAILVGLGIVLIVAHNWDQLSKGVKSILAFLPVVLGQVWCAYALFMKANQPVWRESGSAFLFFAMGACIALIGQIYHIPGDLSSFLLTWLLLCLPLVYLLPSSTAAVLYILGITYYGGVTGYELFNNTPAYSFWVLLLLILPYYIWLRYHKASSNALNILHVLVPLSIIIILGTLVQENPEWLVLAYMSLFGLFYNLGMSKLMVYPEKPNFYRGIASAGSLLLLFVLSFDLFWVELAQNHQSLNVVLQAPEFWGSIILTFLGLLMAFWNQSKRHVKHFEPFAWLFIAFFLVFLLGLVEAGSYVLTNLLIVGLGIWTIQNGAKKDHLGIMNFGLTIITILIICRFFDTNLSFIARGTLFLMVGCGFFLTNYFVLSNRKKNENK